MFIIVFLPKFGLLTAAIVSSVAMTIMLLIIIWYSKLKVGHYKPLLSLLLVAASIYILVYIIDIENIIYAIALKAVALMVVVFGILIILSINPVQMVKGFVK
jgi:hypothetical protein